MNSDKKLRTVSAAVIGQRKISLKVSGAVWLFATSLWLAGGGNLQAAALVWNASVAVNNNWDTNTADTNWRSVSTVSFNNGDSVTFNNNGFPSTNVNVVGFVQPAAITVDTSVASYAFTNATGSIIGTGGLLVFGTGKLTLATTNGFSGGTTVSNALLQLNSTTAAGPGPITNSSGTVYVNFGGLANSLTCFGTATFTNSGHTGGIGTLNGSGTLAINSPGQVFDFTGNLTGYGGTLILSNCTSGVRFNGTTGSSAATFDLGNGTLGLSIRNGATAIALGGLAGGNGTTLSGNTSVAYGATFTIGGTNVSSTFGGKIANSLGTIAINKVGTGTLTLSGTNNSYSGATTVSGGVLAITGSAWPTNSTTIDVATNGLLDVSGLTGSLLTLSSNQTLTGSGTIRGNVNTPTNSTILPGDGVGTLTVSNGTVSSAGLIVMELNRTNFSATNSQLKASAITITGGTLTVTNLGPDLHTGDSFKLFSVAIGGGGFTAVSLPASNVLNTVQYVWTNRLATDGSIQVLSGASAVNSNPTNIVVSVGSGKLSLSWPADHTGWRLLVQTNNLAAGVSANTNDWTTVVGSSAIYSTNLTIDPTKPAAFYRLVYP